MKEYRDLEKHQKKNILTERVSFLLFMFQIITQKTGGNKHSDLMLDNQCKYSKAIALKNMLTEVRETESNRSEAKAPLDDDLDSMLKNGKFLALIFR
jgi:hypothetical protein